MMQQITPGTIESESQWGDGNAAGTVECESHWGTATLTGSSTFPACFELELTTDLPNGPYTELGGMGGKVYVVPGATYNDVAGVLIAGWIKMRGAMMNTAIHGSSDGNEGHTEALSRYSENWKVGSIEYKGGSVNRDGAAVAGTHNAQLLIIQKVASAQDGADGSPPGCCIIA